MDNKYDDEKDGTLMPKVTGSRLAGLSMHIPIYL
jgi:hypothetical protein